MNKHNIYFINVSKLNDLYKKVILNIFSRNEDLLFVFLIINNLYQDKDFKYYI